MRASRRVRGQIVRKIALQDFVGFHHRVMHALRFQYISARRSPDDRGLRSMA